MLTRITDWKISCAYIHVYWITKNWGPGPNNSLRHADNRGYFSGLSLTRNQREAHVLLGEGSGEIWTCSCWEKGNFIIINEFKYGQTWKIWPSPLSLSLYSTLTFLFSVCDVNNKKILLGVFTWPIFKSSWVCFFVLFYSMLFHLWKIIITVTIVIVSNSSIITVIIVFVIKKLTLSSLLNLIISIFVLLIIINIIIFAHYYFLFSLLL